ncbi:hypothetical protein [Breznakiella homolactica]|uniref:Uncharacterized protein n=1 Tax=Breznakiella homolactica TaxID=2798577 RepID=A0A7T7XQN4_9SPIR|nr:hypothetical protein [Breznakiella homolactica]QQO10711.1 hypothetical protein JFL75_07300 [Breznakiella homolactica]
MKKIILLLLINQWVVFSMELPETYKYTNLFGEQVSIVDKDFINHIEKYENNSFGYFYEFSIYDYITGNVLEHIFIGVNDKENWIYKKRKNCISFVSVFELNYFKAFAEDFLRILDKKEISEYLPGSRNAMPLFFIIRYGTIYNYEIIITNLSNLKEDDYRLKLFLVFKKLLL